MHFTAPMAEGMKAGATFDEVGCDHTVVRSAAVVIDASIPVIRYIMFALLMVIIVAFIGIMDLGREIFRVFISADAGKGPVIGLCAAFMGLAVDRLVTVWADLAKAGAWLDAELGVERPGW